MSKPETTYDQIAKAIGNVCIWWTELEGVTHDIILHMAVCLEPSFERQTPWDILHITLSNDDVRQKFATAKLLAHMIEYESSPKFYERVEKLFNYLDNIARPERNRYVHDGWSHEGQEVVRSRMGAKIERVQARQRVIALWTERRFPNIAAIESFVTNLQLAYEDLVTLDNHIAWLTGQKGQPPKSLQPLPLDWKSLAHHELRGADMPEPQPLSSPAQFSWGRAGPKGTA
jgi:hypothetical protein